MNIRQSQGVVALISVLIIGTSVLIIAVVTSLLGAGELQMGFYHSQSDDALYATDGCVEEAGYRLKINSLFNSGTVSLGDIDCSLLVTPTGLDKAVSASSTNDVYTNEVEAIISLPTNAAATAVGADIFSWREE